MAENKEVNTITITLNEYKNMMDEVTLAKAEVKAKESEISEAKARTAVVEERLRLSEEKENTIYVSKLPEWINPYGVKIDKSSPELEKIIRDSVSDAQEKQIKKLKESAENARDEYDHSIKTYNKEIVALKEKNKEEISKLKEQLERAKEDYENLKLDKAAVIVEAKRLEEINKLKEEIATLEQEIDNEDSDYFYIDNWFIRIFFGKLIKRVAKDKATRWYNYLRYRIRSSEVNTTSAIGDAKEYLKKFTNDEKVRESNNNSTNKSCCKSYCDGYTTTWASY